MSIARGAVVDAKPQRSALSSRTFDIDSNVTHIGVLHIDADRADVGSGLHTTVGELGEFYRCTIAEGHTLTIGTIGNEGPYFVNL